MRKRKLLKRAISLLLSFCMVLAGVFGNMGNTTVYAAEGDETTSTTVYFYDSDNWYAGENPGLIAHAWIGADDLTGNWGDTRMTPSEAGENWYEVTVNSAPGFTIIISDAEDTTETIRTMVTISDTTNVYVSKSGVFASKAEAEASVTQTTVTTTVYYYDSYENADYNNIYAHAYYYQDATLTKDITSWPGVAAQDASEEIGANWMKFVLEHDAATTPCTVMINDNNQGTIESKYLDIKDTKNNYACVEGVYGSKSAAEAAMGIGSVDDASTTLYFYDSDGWYAGENEGIIAHAWGDAGNLTGDWGTTKMTTSEVGEGWYEVTVAAEPAFTIIIADADDTTETIRTMVTISDSTKVYITTSGVYSSAEEALSPKVETTIYVYNSMDSDKVYVHAYYREEGAESDTSLTSWPGKEAEAASDLGVNWYKVTFEHDASKNPINVMINDATSTNRYNLYVTRTTDNYAYENNVYSSLAEANYAMDPTSGVVVYFYNSSKWENVNAYAYGATGEVLGGWPGTAAVAADVTGDGVADENWVKVICSALPGSIIFFNAAAESERAELAIPDEEHVYVAINAVAYASAQELLDAVANDQAVVYFLNSENWEKVYAYAEDAEGNYIGSDKPGIEATKDTTLGDQNWYKVTIPTSAIINPFKITFSDGVNQSTESYDVIVNVNNYATITGLYDSKSKALNSVGLGSVTKVYFLNSADWPTVGAYVWGDPGEVLGGWGETVLSEDNIDSTVMVDEKDESAGTKTWYYFEIESAPPFNLIMFNTENDQKERIDLAIADSEVYITPNGLWGSKEEAELSEGLGDLSRMTTVYFLNHRGWGDINAYTFYEKEDGTAPTIGKTWPGKAATKAEGVGTSDKWWSIAVPKDASVEGNGFGIIFNDGVNQTDDIKIEDKEYVYAIAYGASHKLFNTPEEAEAAVAKDPYEDHCEDGPNTDIENYNVSYSGQGAALPYVTYEAEKAATNATVLEKQTAYREFIQSEASGRQAVELKAEGEYVEFTLTEAANSIVLRYAMPDSEDGAGINATLSMYVDGEEKQNLDLTSEYAWLYGVYPFNNRPDNKDHRYYDEVRVLFDETMPAGTKIKLQKDADDAAAYYVIDFMDCELVGPANEQPENSLSVIEFGATPNDETDDAEAFKQCILAASEAGMEVWIPAGTFVLEKEEALDVTAVTIRGAGMWHTNLVGAGVSFHYRGTCKFYDFAMTGVSKVRDDSGDLACFEGASRSTNVTIQNIWMEHVKVGIWANNTENLAILGCRIRNTWADGINMCSGTYNAVVENNNVRNTGDDCIAIWPWLADCGNNTITHNTIMVPSLANGVAVYGGYGHVVENNHVYDIINNGGGICIGTEFDTAKPFSGTITVKNNLLERCGSMQSDENYPIGSIWVWSAAKAPLTTADYIIESNTIKDSVHSSVLIECDNNVDDVVVRNNTMIGGGDGILVLKTAEGSGEQYGNTFTDIGGMEVNVSNENFTFLDTIRLVGTYGQKVNEMTVEGSLTNGDSAWTVTEGGDDVPEVGTQKEYTITNGTRTETVIPDVSKKPLTVTADNKSKVYDGKPYEEELTFAYVADELVGDDTVADLSVKLATEGVNAGTYDIYGTSESANYEVTVVPGTLTIEKANAEITVANEVNLLWNATDVDLAALAGVTVVGEETPVYEVTEGSNILEVTENGIATALSVGTAKVAVNLPESVNYTAAETKTIDVTVNGEEMGDGIYVPSIADQTYTGTKIVPEVVVYDGLSGKKLTEGVDYTLSYKNNTKAYTLAETDAGFKASKAPKVIIKGKGNYTDSITKYFKIQPKNIADAEIKVDYTPDMVATNKNLKPLSKVLFNGKKLPAGAYSVQYFAVSEDGTVSSAPGSVKAAGKYQMVITGKGNFKGTVTKDITVYEKNAVLQLKDMVVYVEGSTKGYATEYTGKAIEPEITIAPKNAKTNYLAKNMYEVSYDDKTNVEIGTSVITITGKPEAGLIGSVTKTFKITGTNLKSVAKVDTANWQNRVEFDYVNGEAIQPMNEVGTKNLVTLVAKSANDTSVFIEDVHYTVSYKKNDKPGTATMVFTGIGKYTGTVTKTFTVDKIDLSKHGLSEGEEGLNVTVLKDSAPYAKKGSKIELAVSYKGLPLTEGVDYKLTYKYNKAVTTENTKVGKEPQIVISGKGVFKGNVKDVVKFTIYKADLADSTVTAANKVYTNKAGKYKVIPVVKAADGSKLKNNKDFTCAYYLTAGEQLTSLKDDAVVEAGSVVTVVVTAKDNSNYVGSNKATYNVVTADIAKASVKINSKVYTGSEIKITSADIKKIKVGKQTLVEGTDYEIDQESYVNNINKGTASVVIKGKGNYAGSEKTVTFKITTRKMAWWFF